ncbi:DNA_repair helicase [Hexamita inflata]|uniref:DNA repair helicase n=1 Tax=Hexamita inflata TaxID=28002 RepID=A0AA86NTE9_9EUKA|nr:DNA repair helicase [Hexamita inflata]
MPVYVIESVHVDFPFEAYPQQIEYMTYFIKSMQSMSHCALEAPTGFGKTACVFAAYMGFQAQFDLARKFIDEINAFVGQSQFKKKVQDILEYVGLRLSLSFEKIQDILKFCEKTTLLKQCIQFSNQSIIVMPVKAETPKLFFTSRTHEQLKQAAFSLTKQFSNTPITTYLAARTQLCQNPEVVEKSKRSKISLNTVCKSACKNKTCSFDSGVNTVPIMANDFEDFCEQNVIARQCPFFAARNMLESAKIIFCPYNYILDSSLKSEPIKKALNNAIVVFDEAHSVPDMAKSAYSTKFSKQDVDAAIHATRTAMQIIHDTFLGQITLQQAITDSGAEEQREKYKQLDNSLAMFKTINLNLKSMVTVKQNDSEIVFMQNLLDRIPLNAITDELLEALEAVDYTLYHVKNDKTKGQKYKVLVDQSQLDAVQYGKVSEVSQILKIYMNACKYSKDFTEFEVLVTKNDETTDYNLQCFSPRIAISHLVSDSIRTILLTSGTLSPLQYIDEAFELRFEYKQTLKHFFDLSKQLQASIIKGIDQNNPIIGTFNNRTPEYYNNISVTISELSAQMPNVGILVFVSSYGIMNDFMKYFEPVLHLNPKHKQTKVIFENQEALKEFKYNVKQENRTILVAVQRGKLSEGIDFADDLCRGVFIVSIPFPNVRDVALARNMAYLDRQKGALTGQKYYMLQAFMAVNQAIGRVIRHSKDYGQVFLLDERYTDNKMFLPSWFSEVLTTKLLHQPINSAIKKSSEFFGNKRQDEELQEDNELLNLIDNDIPLENIKIKIKQERMSVQQIILEVAKFRALSIEVQDQKIKTMTQWLKSENYYDQFKIIIKQKDVLIQANMLAKYVKILPNQDLIPIIFGACDKQLIDEVLALM